MLKQRIFYYIPVLISRLRIKEECGSRNSLIQKVLRKISDPLENLEPSIALKHEKGNNLLEEETNNDCWPWDQATIFRGGPKGELEDEETENRDGAVTEGRVRVLLKWSGKESI